MVKKQLKHHFLTTLKKRSLIVAYGSLLLFLVANVALTQLISPLYFQLQQPNRQIAIHFLQTIKPLPEFSEKLVLYEDQYGAGLEEEVYAPDRQRDLLINKLEQTLKSSPSQRDILYSLYLLYSDRGDLKTANAYFDMAKEVDPTIGQ